MTSINIDNFLETTTLWGHQKEGIKKAADRDYFAFFYDMGTGKTATAITLLRWWLLKDKKLKNVLILCPPVVIRQWAQEFKVWSKLFPFVVCLDGPGAKRVKLLKENTEPRIYITNYESLTVVKGFMQEILKKDLYALICDECHKLKSIKAGRTKEAVKLGAIADKRILLSGTPVLNTPMDLYSQYLVMDRGEAFGNNFYVFQAMYFYDANAARKGQNGYFPLLKPRKGIEDEFNKVIHATGMRVEKKDCLDLPPMIKKEVIVEMSPKQKKIYKEMNDDFVAYISDTNAAVASMALVKAMRLQQIVTGFVNTEDISGVTKEMVIPGKNNRLDALQGVLEEIGEDHKVIIWSCFKFNYIGIADVCKKLKIDYTELHGGVSASKRQENIDKFRNNPKCRVIIANQQAGGTGLNLIEASYSIYYSRTYSLEHDLQSEARNYRGGSEIHEKVTRIDLMTPGTLDQVIVGALRNKMDLAENILAIPEKLK